MIITTAIILGAIIVGTTLVAKYWRKILDFLKLVIGKLKRIVKGIMMGCAVFIKKIGDKFQNRTKHYSKSETGKWKETIVNYEQNPEEIPEKYREYAGFDPEKEYDLTQEFSMELQKK